MGIKGYDPHKENKHKFYCEVIKVTDDRLTEKEGMKTPDEAFSDP